MDLHTSVIDVTAGVKSLCNNVSISPQQSFFHKPSTIQECPFVSIKISLSLKHAKLKDKVANDAYTTNFFRESPSAQLSAYFSSKKTDVDLTAERSRSLQPFNF